MTPALWTALFAVIAALATFIGGVAVPGRLSRSRLQRILAHLQERGIGVLITDHNVRETLKITDRAYILRDGEVFRAGEPAPGKPRAAR